MQDTAFAQSFLTEVSPSQSNRVILSFPAQRYLAEGLAQVAVAEAKRLGVDVVSSSGGVAYNEHIAHAVRRFVEEKKLRVIVHRSIPAGDGGASFGQAIAAGHSNSSA